MKLPIQSIPVNRNISVNQSSNETGVEVSGVADWINLVGSITSIGSGLYDVYQGLTE